MFWSYQNIWNAVLYRALLAITSMVESRAKNAMAEELIPQSNLSHVQVLMKRSHVQQAMSSNNKKCTVTAILENTTAA